jgi:hypothetical protein
MRDISKDRTQRSEKPYSGSDGDKPRDHVVHVFEQTMTERTKVPWVFDSTELRPRPGKED